MRWKDGVWLGIRFESGESIVEAADGVAKAETSEENRRKEDGGATAGSMDSRECRGSRTQEQEEDFS